MLDLDKRVFYKIKGDSVDKSWHNLNTALVLTHQGDIITF